MERIKPMPGSSEITEPVLRFPWQRTGADPLDRAPNTNKSLRFEVLPSREGRNAFAVMIGS